jgi:hypothetical protein
MNKVLLEKLFKMNGLSVTGSLINEDEKKADVLHDFGLNPTTSHENGGVASEAGVSKGITSLTEDNIETFNLK